MDDMQTLLLDLRNLSGIYKRYHTLIFLTVYIKLDVVSHSWDVSKATPHHKTKGEKCDAAQCERGENTNKALYSLKINILP